MAEPWWIDQLGWLLQARWKKGAEQYGEQSFGLRPQEIQREILQELVDVPGWLFVLWRSLQRNRWRSRTGAENAFLRAVRKRVTDGRFEAPQPEEITTTLDVLREIERLAAVGACNWQAGRARLESLCSRIEAITLAKRPKTKDRISDQPTKGQRGGYRD